MTIPEIIKGHFDLIESSIKKVELPTIFCFHCGNEIKESDIDSEYQCPICFNDAYKLDDDRNIIIQANNNY
jgi:Zn finger protein HypA/HybF involved in hydrogenase expression